MATRKRGLGRGLDALLGGKPVGERAEVPVVAAEPGAAVSEDAAAPTQAPEETLPSGEHLARLPVEMLRRGRYQPRREMDQGRLEELAASIRANGVMQPIVARALPSGKGYEIIAGERRWRAAQLAGLDRVPVIVRDVPDDVAMALALIENIQREDLSPVEEAVALRRLVDEFGLTQKQVAETVGKSRTTVTNLLRLLQLEGEVRSLLEQGELEMGHARALLTLEPADQLRIARAVVGKGLSVRQAEALARAALAGEKPARKGARRAETAGNDPDTERLERRLSERVGAPVTIRQGSGGAGQLVIRYSSLDELEGILAHIR
ncbi:MAG: ParB/RepB/Spo0J family partition protein [Pseudomonadales bacterium]|jgi:ParB family chromosome partitioning protein|nr:ParB/RepB/Spo0J family partition protein [Pseudomonadales bacterium]